MSQARGKYDEVLSAILVEQESIIGFLSTIFQFLARRTDFYYVPEGAYENVGFPHGVAEELTVKVLRNCDPKRRAAVTPAAESTQSLNDDIMCSTVAHEVEVEAEDDTDDAEQDEINKTAAAESSQPSETREPSETLEPDRSREPSETLDSPRSREPARSLESTGSLKPPDLPPAQRNSEAYNGAVRENYSWAQTIMDLDVTVHLPTHVKSSKDLRVNITAAELCVACIRSKEIILEGSFPFKVKAQETYWSFSERRLVVHLEKQQERWWSALLTSETPIDLSKIDCSRPLDELPEDQVAKVRELQWNHMRKLTGLPTSGDLKNEEILRRAWNLEGSPFKGQAFDPSVLRQ